MFRNDCGSEPRTFKTLFLRSIRTMRPVVAVEKCSGSCANRSAALAEKGAIKRTRTDNTRIIGGLYSSKEPATKGARRSLRPGAGSIAAKLFHGHVAVFFRAGDTRNLIDGITPITVFADPSAHDIEIHAAQTAREISYLA